MYNSVNIDGNMSSFATRGFLGSLITNTAPAMASEFPEHEYGDSDGLRGTWCAGWIVSTSSPRVLWELETYFVETFYLGVFEVAEQEYCDGNPPRGISRATKYGYGVLLKIILGDAVDTVCSGHQCLHGMQF
ncbi:hypothetical protein TSAR_014781 [Trichomalopsis sarcophagae]|uniref:Uncharacterized protein n=1 Tax=Trichomalopsis sarcophagae TaxID=543379 RepID=A0A232EHE1_9HYME|nr:hypothetical protein TSAR_014781 [Trichomalopsis sarcophagae]